MDINKNKKDVIIIGAGPAGSTAALKLAREGYHVVMVDKDESPGLRNSCAGGMPYTLSEKLHLDPQIIQKEIYGCKLHYCSRIRRFKVGAPSFVTVYRREFDNYLAQRAVQAGAQLELKKKAIDVKKEKDGYRVYIKNMKDNNVSSWSSPLVIFADGVNTLAQKTFGIGFNKTPDTTCLALAYELEDKQNERHDFEIFCQPERIPWGNYWVFPKKDRISVGVGCLCSKITINLRKCLDNFIDEHPELKKKKKVRFSAGLIPITLAEEISQDGCMVIGDAAGMVNPLTGGGLVYAIKSGELAASASLQYFQSKKAYDEVGRVYNRKFILTKHFWWLKGLRAIEWSCVAVSNKIGKSLYPPMAQFYCHSFAILPIRFIKSI